MGHKVPCKIGTLICHSVTLRPLIFPQEEVRAALLLSGTLIPPLFFSGSLGLRKASSNVCLVVDAGVV